MSAGERTALYRLYATDGQLLYLGVSQHPEFRWKRHSDCQPWWHLVARKDVSWYPDRKSALAAEVKFTAEEKPLYDRSWHGVRHHAAQVFDDAVGVVRVLEWLHEKVQACQPGTRLMTGQVAAACGVARTTASSAMYKFSQEGGRLVPVFHGRYVVASPDMKASA